MAAVSAHAWVMVVSRDSDAPPVRYRPPGAYPCSSLRDGDAGREREDGGTSAVQHLTVRSSVPGGVGDRRTTLEILLVSMMMNYRE